MFVRCVLYTHEDDLAQHGGRKRVLGQARDHAVPQVSIKNVMGGVVVKAT